MSDIVEPFMKAISLTGSDQAKRHDEPQTAQAQCES